MARLCERPGCSAAASVAYGFEAAQALVWLATFEPELGDAIRAGALCRRHADSLTPPRGWWLDDRRELRPKLFHLPSEAATDEPPEAASPRARPRRTRPEDTTEELPFPLLDDEGAPARPGDDDTQPTVGPDPSAAASADDTPGTPWTPVFDRDDDLGGVLDARSPLLSRAFGSRVQRREA